MKKLICQSNNVSTAMKAKQKNLENFYVRLVNAAGLAA